MTNETLYTVCSDCGSQSAVGVAHSCSDDGKAVGQRLAAELVDKLLAAFQSGTWYGQRGADAQHAGAGLLWLFRIAYRIRSRMNGLEKYRDRAELARAACELGGELYR